MTYRINCPFCEFANKYEAEDLNWYEDAEEEKLCVSCGEKFTVVTECSVEHVAYDPVER